MRFPANLTALVSVCLFAAFASAQPKGQDIDAFAARRLAETGTPGMAVAVVVDGKVVHSKGYGVANAELGSPVTPDSVFNLASITKTFTAFAVLKLAEEGRLTLDDPVARHLDRLPAAWSAVTVRHLISNTSGIRSFTSLTEPPCNSGDDARKYKRGDAIREVACFPLEFAPGEKWKYADTGFYLAGMLIEKLSGVSYESYLQKAVLSPLGMKSTRIVDYTDVIPHRVSGYSFENGKLRNADRFEFEEFSNGGLMSTLNDMIRFEKAFLAETVIRKSSLDLMLANTRLNSGEVVESYGLGVGLSPFRGERRFGHTGGGGLGFATAFTHFPLHRVTVIVLANADQEGIGTFANEIAAMYFRRTPK